MGKTYKKNSDAKEDKALFNKMLKQREAKKVRDSKVKKRSK